MTTSLTWQYLPNPWQQLVIDGILLIHEAAELMDLFLMAPGEWVEHPPHLQPAVDRLLLWQMDAGQMVH